MHCLIKLVTLLAHYVAWLNGALARLNASSTLQLSTWSSLILRATLPSNPLATRPSLDNHATPLNRHNASCTCLLNGDSLDSKFRVCDYPCGKIHVRQLCLAIFTQSCVLDSCARMSLRAYTCLIAYRFHASSQSAALVLCRISFPIEPATSLFVLLWLSSIQFSCP